MDRQTNEQMEACTSKSSMLTQEQESEKMNKLTETFHRCKSPMLTQVYLFVLRFYSPVNPMGSCRARSVYLTTRLLGRLSPLSG